MEIIAKEEFNLNGDLYVKGDIVKVDKDNIKSIWKLNEKGLINTISAKDMKKLYNEILYGKKKEPKDEIINIDKEEE